MNIYVKLTIGAVIGLILTLVTKKLDPKDELQIKTIFFIALEIGIAVEKILRICTSTPKMEYINWTFSCSNARVTVICFNTNNNHHGNCIIL